MTPASDAANERGAVLTTVPDLLTPVLRYWLLIAGVALLFGVAAYFLSYQLEPSYEASVTVATVDPDGGQMLGGASVFGQLGSLVGIGGLSGGNFVRDSEGVLRSHALIRRFIGEQSLMPLLYPDTWNDPDDAPTIANAIVYFDEDVLAIDVDKTTGLLIVRLNWFDAKIAAHWANDFIGLANRMIRERTREETQRSIKYLSDELAKAESIELRNAIFQLMETNVRTAMLANTREEFAFSVIDPAFAPDEDDYAWPNRKLLALLGMILGGALVTLIVLMRHIRAQSPAGA